MASSDTDPRTPSGAVDCGLLLGSSESSVTKKSHNDQLVTLTFKRKFWDIFCNSGADLSLRSDRKKKMLLLGVSGGTVVS